MKFSEKVKYARMKLLLTQEALAKELGVSYATICRWEKDNREPQIVSQGKFYAFCESKGITFEDSGEKYCLQIKIVVFCFIVNVNVRELYENINQIF